MPSAITDSKNQGMGKKINIPVVISEIIGTAVISWLKQMFQWLHKISLQVLEVFLMDTEIVLWKCDKREQMNKWIKQVNN